MVLPDTQKENFVFLIAKAVIIPQIRRICGIIAHRRFRAMRGKARRRISSRIITVYSYYTICVTVFPAFSVIAYYNSL